MSTDSASIHAPFPIETVPADLLAWAKQTLDVEDFLEQIRQIESGSGHSLESVIQEIRTRGCS